MQEKHKTIDFKKLLDRLQEDSWQLELLISGFAIFGLFYAIEPIQQKLLVAHYDNNTVFLNFFIIVRFSLQILIFNLLLHVLLRGLWIGSLGLRYVFGDIDYKKLNYSEQFTNYLTKKVGSFDAYIGKLENACSVIFALSFLLIFYVFSFFIITFILVAFQSEVPDWTIGIMRVLFVLLATGVVFTFIDFLTQGLLKKNKWTSKIYFPFYWAFSFLTLSFLYRPLVYNLLDNKLGRRISYSLIPIYFLIYVVFHLNYRKSNFITPEIINLSNSGIANSRYYQDDVEKSDKLFIGDFAIQSKVIQEPFMRLIVPLNATIEDGLIEFNADLKPEKDKRGLQFQAEVKLETGNREIEHFNEEYLRTFENKYRFKIDNIPYATDFVVGIVNKNLCFESYIGIQGLTEGKHTIEFLSLKNKDSDTIVSIRKIPFWYYKN